MGRSASIDFKVQQFTSRTLDVVHALLEGGWSYDDNGHIQYAPLGDLECSDWQWAGLHEWEMVCNIIRKKEQHDEMIGLSLGWGDDQDNSGCIFLFRPTECLIMIIINWNRRCIAESPDLTDYTWYLQRLVPPFEKAGLRIESLQCFDHV